jgi:MFS family permease
MTIQNHSLSKPVSVPKSIWAIGIASFLINVSSAVVFSLSAVYLKTILGVATGWIGLLEGTVEACAYAVKVFSGIFSDYLRRRKSIMVWGFALATLARPVLAISSSFGAVFTARVLDRIGNGIQSTPRDALVGDLSPAPIRGTCYGLRQSLATAGSFFGGIVGVIAMYFTHQNFQQVFWIATIPAVMGLLIVIALVKDSVSGTPHLVKKHPIHWKDLPRLGRSYWILMVIVGIFMLARVGEAMLILHAHQNFGLSETYIPLILILYNGTNALISYPIGKLSDKISRYTLLAAGFIILVLADILLASANNIGVMLVGVALWGVQMGITQSMFVVLTADTAPDDLRGTGFGIFYLISALSLVLAGSIGGNIAQYYGESRMFMVSGIIGAFALVCLAISLPFIKKLRKQF